MSCCGNKRAALVASPAPGTAQRQAPAITSPVAPPGKDQKMWADVPFEYQGAGTLTLTGSTTGRIYRWVGKGAVQAVDYRDAGGLIHARLLRRMQ